MSDRIGLIHNPNATRNRDRPAPSHPRLLVREPYSGALVADALRDFRAAGCEVVAVNGGDGTVREVLSALPIVYGDKPPRLVVFAAGATDLIAADVGSGRIDDGLTGLIAALDAESYEIRSRRPLKVNWLDGSGQTATGMFFGAAAFVRATELSHKIRARGVDRARRWGSTQGWAVGLTLIGVFGAAIVGPARKLWLAGRPMTIETREGPRFLFLATTLDKMMMNLWPFWGEGSGGLKFLDIDAPPKRLSRALLPALKGRPRPWMHDAGYQSGVVEDLEVALAGRFVLDGEFYRPGPDGRLRLEAGALVEFLVVWIPLQARIARELKAPVAKPAREAAKRLAAMAKGGAVGVLFYGSGFRAGTLEGVLDFYVIVDRMKDWPSGPFVAWAGGELPPNVEYREFPDLGVRAKVAIIELKAFSDGVWTYSLDTTLWARFAQPCALAAVRGPADRKLIERAVAQAVATAAGWAATLGPARGEPNAYWTALFAATYAAELRVEKTGRSGTILEHAEDRYAAVLTEAWDAQGLAYAWDRDQQLVPAIGAVERKRALSAWRLRRWLGKPLNLARLVKACFTFEGAADYIVWKVERHTGVKLPLTPWRRRHPLLSAPWALWKLWKAGVLK